MHIQFKKVIIKNFLSIGNAELTLSNMGFILINGINNCKEDNAKSNGVGKSSLIDSILWALTGETARGTKDIINRYNSGGAKVELDFIIDNKKYKIIRCKEDSEFGTNLFLYVDGENKSGKGIRDTQQILENYLPDITAELLGSVIILGQGLPQRFTNNTPSGRKEVLEKLSKSDFMINDIKDKLSNRKIELNNNLRKVEDDLLSYNSKKSLLENTLQKLREDKALLDNAPNYNEEIDKYKEQLYSLEMDKNVSNSLCEELNIQVENKLKEYQDWTFKVSSNYNHECQVIDEYYNVFDLQANLNKLKATIDAKEESIKKLESIKDICPTCGQKLPDVHKVDTTEQRAELQELKNKYELDSKYWGNLFNEIQDRKKNVLDKLNKTGDEIKQQGTHLREEFNKANNILQQYKKEIDNINLTIERIKLNKENYEKQSKTINEDIANVEKELNNFSEKILYNNIEKDKIESHLEIITKMITIATRDFRGYLLTNIIEYINAVAKNYSKHVFDTDKIEFRLDGNNIFIGYNHKSYENLSGGEKQKVDLIIQFSIRDMLSNFLNFSSNILVLDEIFDGLDEFGCQRIIDLITNTFNDIESIFIITHHQELQIPCDKQIIIIKNENGISSIEGA